MTDRSPLPNALLDDIAKLATNAAGVLQGARDEVETAIKSRLERFIADQDLVSREEFESVRAMAEKAREENERLAQKLAELEARLPSTG